jgi:predicted ATPase
MQRIAIKNFGPVLNAEIELKKTVVLIGGNATGKSTVTKLISTFLWMEKALFRGWEEKWFKKENRLKNFFLPYHRIENFLQPDSVIEYDGQAYTITYSHQKISVERRAENRYPLPQIVYIPAERNLLTYLRTTRDIKSEGALQDFELDYFNAANSLKGSLRLPVHDFEIEYSKRHGMLYVKDHSHKIKITEAASGLQSSAPLCLVSDYLSKKVQDEGHNDAMTSGNIRKFEKKINEILNDTSLSEKQRRVAISALSDRFNKKAFVNIVEEPEQNLFPVSQMKLIKSLVSICNQNADNRLVISTHSPYVLATVNNLIQAGKAGKKYPDRVNGIVDRQLWLDRGDVFAGIVREGRVDDITDTEVGLIQMEQIDSVSRMINEEFDSLYQLDADNDAGL